MTPPDQSHTRIAELEAALRKIRDMEPEPFAWPPGWDAEQAACQECADYRDHPIQNGICNKHRRPIWDQQAHADREERRAGWRAKSIARQALKETPDV